MSRCGFSDKPAVYRSTAETLEPGVAGCVSLATAKGYGASPHPAIPWKRGLQRLQVKGGALRLRFHEIVRYRKLLRVCVQYWGVKPMEISSQYDLKPFFSWLSTSGCSADTATAYAAGVKGFATWSGVEQAPMLQAEKDNKKPALRIWGAGRRQQEYNIETAASGRSVRICSKYTIAYQQLLKTR